MAVYTEESVKANVRVREGKRVFYLADGDHLTPSAREWLRQEKVEVLPYHDLGKFKWENLGCKYELEGYRAANQEDVKRAKEILEI